MGTIFKHSEMFSNFRKLVQIFGESEREFPNDFSLADNVLPVVKPSPNLDNLQDFRR